jgi:hypothetical protein
MSSCLIIFCQERKEESNDLNEFFKCFFAKVPNSIGKLESPSIKAFD